LCGAHLGASSLLFDFVLDACIFNPKKHESCPFDLLAIHHFLAVCICVRWAAIPRINADGVSAYPIAKTDLNATIARAVVDTDSLVRYRRYRD
jgi:hypothetical protein